MEKEKVIKGGHQVIPSDNTKPKRTGKWGTPTQNKIESNIGKLLYSNLIFLFELSDLTCTMAAISGNKKTLREAQKQRKLILDELKKSDLAKKLK